MYIYVLLYSLTQMQHLHVVKTGVEMLNDSSTKTFKAGRVTLSTNFSSQNINRLLSGMVTSNIRGIDLQTMLNMVGQIYFNDHHYQNQINEIFIAQSDHDGSRAKGLS